MNTIIDLNSPGNVSYNSASDYNFVANNAGNLTITVDAYTAFTPAKQITLTTFANAYRDLLVDFSFSDYTVANVQYVGSYANIGLLQISPVTWRYYGIRDIDRYDEAFANTRVWTQDPAGVYTMVVGVADQVQDYLNYQYTVTANAAPAIVVSGNVLFTEDNPANISVVTLTGNSSQTYNLWANIDLGGFALGNGTANANSVVVSGNLATINASLAGNTLILLPAPDWAANIASAVDLQLRLANTAGLVDSDVLNIQIANSHSEYTVATTYDEDVLLANLFVITDQDTLGATYDVSIVQTSGNTGNWVVANVLSPSNVAYTFANTKANINGVLDWLPAPDDVGNVEFSYFQAKTRANVTVVQAANVTVPLTVANTHQDYVYPGANVAAYIQQRIDIGQWLVNDLPYTPGLPEREYSVTLSHTNGVGNVWIGNVLHNSNVISLTGNANVINLQLGNSFWEETANAAYTTEGAVAATATFVFDLTRTAPDVKVLANAVTTNVTVSVPGATMTKNNDAWSGQNGFFGYVDNSLSYAAPSNTFAYPTGNIAIIWPNDLANNNNFVNFTTVTSWNGRWTDTATSVAPPSTSNVAWDAYQDTWNLSRYDYTSLYNVSSAVAAANANINLTGGVPNMEAKDWFMANDPHIVEIRNTYGNRFVPSTGNTWTLTFPTAGGVGWYNPGSNSFVLANSYANMTSGPPNDTRTASLLPLRQTYVSGRYYNIPATANVDLYSTNYLPWQFGLPGDNPNTRYANAAVVTRYMYEVDVTADRGTFVYAGNGVTFGNSVSWANIVATANNSGTSNVNVYTETPYVGNIFNTYRYKADVTMAANVANLTYTVRRYNYGAFFKTDEFVIVSNAVSQLNIIDNSVTSLTLGMANNNTIYSNTVFGNTAITDTDPLGEKAYQVVITVSSSAGNTIGNIWLDGVDYGLSANISGNKATLNNTFSNASSYFENRTTAGTAVFNYDFSRIQPDIKHISSANANLVLSVPALGNTWRGGVYYGEYDSGAGNRYMVLYDETAPFTINWWSANGAPTPAVNSNVDGALNTATLVTANAAAYTIANTASNLSANGYTDWFQPSWSELDFMVRAANAVIPSQPSTLLQPGTFPTNNEYWTSTVFDDGARKVQVVAWNANGNVGAVGTDARVFANTHPADLADAARQVIVRSETQGT